MPSVLISGGSGLIGQHLCRLLLEKGYKVSVLSRFPSDQPGINTYAWDVERNEIDLKAIQNCDFLIHLAGVNVGAKRWTRTRKQNIIDSRVESANLIFRHISKENKKLKAFISASAIGYYGTQSSENIYRETDPPGDDFLSRTCQAWEKVADKFDTLGIRAVKIRTGLVLAKEGGALSKLVFPAKLGIASALGHGRQFMPWIHMDDLCAMYLHAIEDSEIKGAYNAVAPEHITNRDFTAKLAQALHRPFWFPKIPAFIIKALFGEMSEMLLEGSKISSDKIQAAGFQFQFPDLDGAFQELLSNYNQDL